MAEAAARPHDVPLMIAATIDCNDLEATIASKPTADYDEAWGGGWIQPDQMAEFVYKSLTEE